MNQFDQFHSALDLTQVSESVFSFNPDSKYFLEDVVKYEESDYPFEDKPQRW